MLIFDSETLALIDANQTALNVYGLSKDELGSLTIADLTHPHDIERLGRRLARRLGSRLTSWGRWLHVTGEGGVVAVELSMMKLDDAWVLVIVETPPQGGSRQGPAS